MDEPLIKPEPLTFLCKDGKERTFVLSNFPAVEGREILMKYVGASLPKIGDYAEGEKVMLKLMSYVAVKVNSAEVRLTTKDLINNHCGAPEDLMKLEYAMMEKNCSFFRDGRGLDFFDNLVQLIVRKVSETLTPSSAQSSPTEKQLSMNFGQSTT